MHIILGVSFAWCVSHTWTRYMIAHRSALACTYDMQKKGQRRRDKYGILQRQALSREAVACNMVVPRERNGSPLPEVAPDGVGIMYSNGVMLSVDTGVFMMGMLYLWVSLVIRHQHIYMRVCRGERYGFYPLRTLKLQYEMMSVYREDLLRRNQIGKPMSLSRILQLFMKARKWARE
jgi:hypothetical protein